MCQYVDTYSANCSINKKTLFSTEKEDFCILRIGDVVINGMVIK